MKRLLSMLLSMAIVVSSFAPTAYAAETAAEDHSHDPAVQQTLETIPATELVTETAETVVSSADLPSNDELFSLYVDSKLYGREISTFGTAARESLNDAERGIYDYLKEKIQYVAANGGSTEFSISDLSALSGVKYQWTNEELGVTSIEGDAETAVKEAFAAQYDLGKIVDALLHDCPYDLYWYDKTTGCTSTYKCSFSGQNTDSGTVWNKIIFKDLVFKFYVSSNYDGAQDNLLDVNTDVSKVSTAAANANDVVNTYSELPDLEKLTNYRDYICGAVSYNHDAAVNGDFASDNDPWQLIWVFDGDESTNVVCEGYAKAFQHLCDLTQFKNAVCYTASGTMAGGTGAGGHMWNIVTMDDGKSYLVDITNSDEGTVGHGGGLFLDGVSGSVENGYVATAGGQSIVFKYDNDTVDILSNDVLTLSDTKYTEPAAVYTITAGQCTNGTIEVDKTVAENGETVTVTATPDQCYTLSTIYVNGAAISGNTFAATEDAVVTATFAVKHTEEYIPAIKADCQTEGFTAGVKCSVCGTVITAPVSLGFGEHSFTNYISNGNGTETATCDNGCGKTDTRDDGTITAKGRCGENATWTLYTDGSLVISGNGDIPDYDVNTKSPWFDYRASVSSIVVEDGITRIGNQAFTNLTKAEKASLPETVTSIGSYAFSYCPALKEVSLPSNIDVLEEYTFNDCSSLVKIVIPDGVTTIANYTFFNCSALETVIFPESLTEIGYQAFYGCSSINELNLPAEMTYIGGYAFAGGNKVKTVKVPAGLTTIEAYTFSNFTSLENITIPDSITSIGMGAFYNCTSLAEVNFGGSKSQWNKITVEEFQNDALNTVTVNCSKFDISAVQCENGTIEVDKAVAENGETVTVTATPDQCYALDAIYVNGTAISGNAFAAIEDAEVTATFAVKHTEEYIPAIKADCQTEGFTAGVKCSVCDAVITAPVSVGFGDHSFTNYVSDNNATCEEDGTKTATCDRCDATDTQADENSALGHSFTEYISNGDGTETSTCDNGCGTKDTRDDGTSTARGTCGKNASWILYSDGELVISGTGDMADFMDGAPWADHLDSIKKITVNDGITSIGACAFSGCVNLKEISLPETLVSIEVYALSYCENLSYIYIPASVTSIGGIVDGYATGAFGECPLLKTAGPKGSGCNIEFGWTTAIPQGAFCDCFYLESVTIPDGITTIGNSAFAYCEGLTDIYMPDSVTSVGYDAFLYCTGLKNIRLSQNLTSISDGMFFYCPGLTQIYIPDSVTSIGSNAFEWCENLSNINIPLSVTKIGNFAFCNCYELTELSYAGSVAEWNNVQCGDAFDTATGSYPTIYCEKGYSGIQRIYGATRFETSYAIADATLYAQGVEKVDTIIVANGMNFADALAGSYLAKVKNAPILMAGPENVSQISHYVSQRLNTGGTVYILGGVNAVSPMVESHLNALTDISLKVVRLAGATRFETNIEILKEAGVTNEEILVCTAYDFADSLSAAAAGKPILLVDTEKDQLNAAQKDYLNSLSGNSFCIVGGVNAVSPKLENQLSAYGTISRLAGATRYETSVMVAEKYIKNPEYAVFAYALNFPDGLCGGSLALSLNAPLILTKAGDDAAAQRYVQSNGIKYGYVLGGSSLVSDAAVNNIYGLPVNTPVSQW